MPEIRTPLWRTLTRAAIPVGVLSLLIALAVRSIARDLRFHSPAVLCPLVAGILMIVGGILANGRWLKDRIVRRTFLVGLNVWAMSGLSLLFFIIVNAIVAMSPQTAGWVVDCTKARLHTLSLKTRNILENLDGDLTLISLIGTGRVQRGAKVFDLQSEVKDILALYQAATPRAMTQTINVYRDRAAAERLALRLKAPVRADTLIVQYGDRHQQIPFHEFLDLPALSPLASPDAATPGLQVEAKITEAVLSLQEGERATVYFTTGHGELAVEGSGRMALNLFVRELKRDNYAVRTLDVTRQAQVPDDCDLLVIAGPTADFTEDDVERLRRYLQDDGRLLLLATPAIVRGRLGRLKELLAGYNVRVRTEAIALDKTVRRSKEGFIRVPDQDFQALPAPHPVTEGLATLNIRVLSASPVETIIRRSTPAPRAVPTLAPPYQATVLLCSSRDGWGETDLRAKPLTFNPATDVKGPLALALAVQPKARPAAPDPSAETQKGPRLIIAGTTWIAVDEVLSRSEGNRAFMMNCVNWLTRREHRLGIPPRRPDRRELKWDHVSRKAVLYITVIAMPLLSIIAGVLVWWRRHR